MKIIVNYLPHRQLRNTRVGGLFMEMDYLPHRQLRK